jgi:MYXO-CTERM domain-containing protein
VATAAAFCDGLGACVPGQQTPCPAGCADTTCATVTDDGGTSDDGGASDDGGGPLLDLATAGADLATQPPEQGCSCRTSGRDPASGAIPAWALLILAVALRLRRPKR